MQNPDDMLGENVISIDFKDRKASFKSALSCDLQARLDKEKYELCAQWLTGGTVCLLFDARSERVKVPAGFKGLGDLRLNFCYSFQLPDFNLNENGIWGTLSFNTGVFFCMVPWQVVYGMQSAELKQGAVWFDNFPKDYDQIDVLGFDEKCERRKIF